MRYLIVLLVVAGFGLAASESEGLLDDRLAVHGEFWPSLAEMTPAERANSEIWIEPGPGSAPEAYSEARAISESWNRGEYEAAIERARGFSRCGDPGEVAVAVSPRKLVESNPGFGPDIRIGERDSLYGCSFDRLNNGWLFASFPARAGDRTYIYSYRSTDDGSTWTELASFSWNYADYVRTTAAVCHGNYLVITIAIGGLSSHRAHTARLSTTTGEVVLYPGDTMFVSVFESTPGDTIVELAAASSEDGNPGGTIYLFGRTKAGALKYAWTDSSCRAWRVRETGVYNYCDNGLDCTYNEGYTDKYVWASWLENYSGDTARLYNGYWKVGDSVFHRLVHINAHGHASNDPITTAVSAYRDTVQIVYLARGLMELRQIYRFGETGGWFGASLSDTWVTRDVVEVSIRRGGGSALAYRNHALADRDVLFRHASRANHNYSEPDTVSEHMPDQTVRIRVEKLADREYGLVYVSTNDTPFGAAYFDRVSVTGVAEPRPPQPAPLGLQALPARDRVRFAFENPAAGPVRLRLFDRAGRLVLKREEHMPAGRQEFEVSPEAAGVLFAVIDAGGTHARTKFSMVR